jgi:hypothetical protein
MNWLELLKSVPSLIGLATKIFTDRKNPPKRASEILGGPEEKTRSEKAKEAADAAADAKFGE